ncbi:MAG: EamA family transporter [Alphaproteobacteria bacterium]
MGARSGKIWLLPALAAMLVWGLWAFLPKIALQSMQPHSVIFYEAFGSLCVSLPVLIFHLKGKLQKDAQALAIISLSSALTVTAIMCYFYALKHGPVAVVVTMTAMYPVISLVLARIFYKERINKVQMVAVAMAMLSIVLLAMPE